MERNLTGKEPGRTSTALSVAGKCTDGRKLESLSLSILGLAPVSAKLRIVWKSSFSLGTFCISALGPTVAASSGLMLTPAASRQCARPVEESSAEDAATAEASVTALSPVERPIFI